MSALTCQWRREAQLGLSSSYLRNQWELCGGFTTILVINNNSSDYYSSIYWCFTYWVSWPLPQWNHCINYIAERFLESFGRHRDEVYEWENLSGKGKGRGTRLGGHTTDIILSGQKGRGSWVRKKIDSSHPTQSSLAYAQYSFPRAQRSCKSKGRGEDTWGRTWRLNLLWDYVTGF